MPHHWLPVSFQAGNFTTGIDISSTLLFAHLCKPITINYYLTGSLRKVKKELMKYSLTSTDLQRGISYYLREKR